MTHRQFITWMAWLDIDWNTPSRSDYYAMQIALEAARQSRKEPEKLELSQFKLEFKSYSAKDKAQSGPHDPKVLMAIWKARLGIKPGNNPNRGK